VLKGGSKKNSDLLYAWFIIDSTAQFLLKNNGIHKDQLVLLRHNKV